MHFQKIKGAFFLGQGTYFFMISVNFFSIKISHFLLITLFWSWHFLWSPSPFYHHFYFSTSSFYFFAIGRPHFLLRSRSKSRFRQPLFISFTRPFFKFSPGSLKNQPLLISKTTTPTYTPTLLLKIKIKAETLSIKNPSKISITPNTPLLNKLLSNRLSKKYIYSNKKG